MNGYDIFKRAMSLLGYTDQNGNTAGGDGLLARAQDVINQLGADLCRMPPLGSLTERIPADSRVCEALTYGTAMLLALGEGDGAKNQLFCGLYNTKRAAAKASGGAISDRLPVDDGGVV